MSTGAGHTMVFEVERPSRGSKDQGQKAGRTSSELSLFASVLSHEHAL